VQVKASLPFRGCPKKTKLLSSSKSKKERKKKERNKEKKQK
jgi:hypothetical protein